MQQGRPNQGLRDSAQEYLHANPMQGLRLDLVEGHDIPVPGERMAELARIYEQLAVFDSRPTVLEAYAALMREVLAQYRHLTEHTGIYVELWQGGGETGLPEQPYPNSAALMADLSGSSSGNWRGLPHLYLYTGGNPHPLLDTLIETPSRAGGVDYEASYGRRVTDLVRSNSALRLTYNLAFRAVHDAYGHAAEGYPFSPRGEFNAWLHHSQMFSPLAQWALSTETLGQSAWVNFGQSYAGLHATLPQPERPYAAQKAALLPARLCDWRPFLHPEDR